MALSSAIIGPGSEAVQLEIKLPQKTINQVQYRLATLDPQVRKELAKDLRTALKGPAASIVADFPRQAPMSGMTPRWGRVKASIRTNPMAAQGRAIAIIGVAGEDKGFNRTVAITERAGSRTEGYTKQGRVMTRVLEDRYPLVGKGGRFIWKAWLKHKPKAVAGALAILNKFVEKYNRGAI